VNAVDFVYLAALACILVIISREDVAQLRIPNRLNVAVALLGVHRALYDAPHFSTIVLEAVAVFSSMLALLLMVSIARRLNKTAVLGAGDFKFLIAAACWEGFEGSAATFILGGLIGILGYLTMRPWVPVHPGRPIAFGPMLAAGLLLVVVLRCIRTT
jgi:Flp pilus assembly protein protease CpaA